MFYEVYLLFYGVLFFIVRIFFFNLWNFSSCLEFSLRREVLICVYRRRQIHSYLGVRLLRQSSFLLFVLKTVYFLEIYIFLILLFQSGIREYITMTSVSVIRFIYQVEWNYSVLLLHVFIKENSLCLL